MHVGPVCPGFCKQLSLYLIGTLSGIHHTICNHIENVILRIEGTPLTGFVFFLKQIIFPLIRILVRKNLCSQIGSGRKYIIRHQNRCTRIAYYKRQTARDVADIGEIVKVRIIEQTVVVFDPLDYIKPLGFDLEKFFASRKNGHDQNQSGDIAGFFHVDFHFLII